MIEKEEPTGTEEGGGMAPPPSFVLTRACLAGAQLVQSLP